MKKLNLLIGFLIIGSVQVIYGQTAQGLLSTADQELDNASGDFKNMMTRILFLLAGGAIVYAAYTAFFDQQNMRRAMIGLISGILFAGVGAAMSFIS